jgi:hypothetical protein
LLNHERALHGFGVTGRAICLVLPVHSADVLFLQRDLFFLKKLMWNPFKILGETMALQLQVGDEAEDALKRKIRGTFSVFDKDSRNACDVREVRRGLFA